MPEVVMPRLSDSMEEGTIISWIKADGDVVRHGDDLVEIETDKATMTYEADVAGVLSIVAQAGATLPIGAPIAHIAGDVEVTPPPASVQAATPDHVQRTHAPAAQPAALHRRADGGVAVKASPVARRMARELGLDLATVQGSGPGGRVRKADVEAAAATGDGRPDGDGAGDGRGNGSVAATESPSAAEPTAKGEVTREEPTRLQKTVARRMAESKGTAPDFALTVEVDMTDAAALRAQLKQAAADGRPVPSFNDFVIRASALALRDVPRANGAYRDGGFELYSRVNVGMAVAGPDALVVPTVFDADQKALGQIATETRALAERVRAGTVTAAELAGGTFTVSNLGMFGIRRFVAIINPPQAAILAVGEMVQAPVVRDGEIQVRTVMELTLACDHRILYGADAARFLGRIRELLEAPLALAF